jgi:glyoxylate reductase
MARRAQGFGMCVFYQDAVAADPATERELRASRTDIATLLKESDFVTLHTPLLPETRHLINTQSLKTMKKTAYLINASRGPVVDEAALAQALKEGWIAGAGIDVFEDEPTVHPGLLGLPNAVLAPHIGSASWETRLQMANLAVDNCLAVLEGHTPPTPVNAEALARR